MLAAGLLAYNGTRAQDPGAAPGQLAGKVLGAGSPIAGSAVTLYAAGEGNPEVLAQGKSGPDGSFALTVGPKEREASAGKVFYLLARGGTPQADGGKQLGDALALLAVLGTKLPKTATVNELTTVASAFTTARFIDGGSISG
jgi:hypothetical protein